MANNKHYELPNAQLLQDSFKAFEEASHKMVELNQLYWEQARQLFQTGIQDSQTLYKVSTPEEFVETMSNILKNNNEFLSKAFLEEMEIVLSLTRDSCNSSCCNFDDIRSSLLQFYDFYTKLVPSPLSLKLDDVVKNAASGNYDALHSLHNQMLEFLNQFGKGVNQAVGEAVAPPAKPAAKPKK